MPRGKGSSAKRLKRRGLLAFGWFDTGKDKECSRVTPKGKYASAPDPLSPFIQGVWFLLISQVQSFSLLLILKTHILINSPFLKKDFPIMLLPAKNYIAPYCQKEL